MEPAFETPRLEFSQVDLDETNDKFVGVFLALLRNKASG